MTTSNLRSNEPIYIIMVREQQGEKLLREWARNNQCQVTIDGPRMKIFDLLSYSRFQIGWMHSWQNVVIWDCWNKRHVYLD